MATTLNPSVHRSSPRPVDAEPIATRDLLNTVFYYRRTAFLIALVIFLLGTAVALLLPPSYTARARLLALNSRVYDQTVTVPDTGPNATVAVDVEMQLLASAELHRELIKRQLGPHASDTQIDARVTAFEAHLHLAKLETGDVIEITYRDRDPQRAAEAIRQLLSIYFDQRADVLTSGRVGFLTAQRDKIRGQLDQANAQIDAYEKQSGVVNVTEQITGAIALDSLLHQQSAEAESTVADNQQTVDVLQENAKSVPKEVELYSDNSEAAHTVGTEETQLFDLEKKRADLASRYLVTSPFVQQIDAQISALKTSISQQKKDALTARRTGYNTYHDTVNDRLAQAKAALAGASARRAVLQNQIASSKDRLKELISISSDLSRLTTQRDMIADNVKDLTTQLDQARVQQNETNGSGSTNVRVIEEPRIPTERGNPPLLFILASLITALLIAGVAIIILSSLRETFLSPQEAQRALHLPVLCSITEREGRSDLSRRDFGRMIAALDSVPTGDLGKTILLLTTQTEGNVQAVAEGLVAALEYRAPHRIALVHMEEETAPPTQDALMSPRPMGLDSKMTIGMDMTRRRLIGLFHELRSSYDYVVVTAPPASAWFESLELSTVADLSVLLIEAAQTRKLVAQNVITQASYIGGTISGLVMTGRRYYIPSWLYRTVLSGRSSRA